MILIHHIELGVRRRRTHDLPYFAVSKSPFEANPTRVDMGERGIVTFVSIDMNPFFTLPACELSEQRRHAARRRA